MGRNEERYRAEITGKHEIRFDRTQVSIIYGRRITRDFVEYYVTTTDDSAETTRSVRRKAYGENELFFLLLFSAVLRKISFLYRDGPRGCPFRTRQRVVLGNSLCRRQFGHGFSFSDRALFQFIISLQRLKRTFGPADTSMARFVFIHRNNMKRALCTRFARSITVRVWHRCGRSENYSSFFSTSFTRGSTTVKLKNIRTQKIIYAHTYNKKFILEK